MLNLVDSLRQAHAFLAGAVQKLNVKHDTCAKSAPTFVPSDTIIEVPENFQAVAALSIKVDGYIKTNGFLVVL